MAKWANDLMMDSALNYIKNNCKQMLVCTSQPADRAGALSAALADVAMASGDFTLGNGDVSGRKVTIAAKADVDVDTSGEGSHVALISDTELLYVTTCTPQPLVAGNTVNFPAWKIEVADPS